MKKIIIALFILIALLIGLSIIWQNHRGDSTELTLIDAHGKSIELLLSSYRQTSVVTAKGDTLAVWSIPELLEINGIIFNNDQKITMFSSDGASIALNHSEIESAYLMQINDVEKPFYRLIIPQDPFPQRWLKYINLITLN